MSYGARCTSDRTAMVVSLEVALLRLIRVKCNLLDLRPLYQFSDPIKQNLIGESGRQTMVMLDLLVEFNAPVTHSISPFFRPGETTFSCHFTTNMALT
jgi:hypothetical protein